MLSVEHLTPVRRAVWGMMAVKRLQDSSAAHAGMGQTPEEREQLKKDVAAMKLEAEQVGRRAMKVLTRRRRSRASSPTGTPRLPPCPRSLSIVSMYVRLASMCMVARPLGRRYHRLTCRDAVGIKLKGILQLPNLASGTALPARRRLLAPPSRHLSVSHLALRRLIPGNSTANARRLGMRGVGCWRGRSMSVLRLVFDHRGGGWGFGLAGQTSEG